MSSSYIMRAKSKDGFAIKLISELFSNLLKFPPFKITDKGIFLRATDQHREILIDLELPRENFTLFKCTNPLYFVVNAIHFYRLLKTIKKKDSVTMFINDQRPLQLGICVDQTDDNDKITTYINITYVQPEEIDLPDGYDNPIIVTSKHFQKLKTLHSIGNEMTVTVVNNSVMKFFVNGKNLFSREISIGEDNGGDDDNDQKSSTQRFTTSHICQLTKCAGQSGNVQIFYNEELPLQIKMRTGTLGLLTVYIKSRELIEQLEDDDVVEEEVADNNNVDGSSSFAKVSIQDKEEESKESDEEEDEEEEVVKPPPARKRKSGVSPPDPLCK